MFARHRDDAPQSDLLVTEAQRSASRLAGQAATLRLWAQGKAQRDAATVRPLLKSSDPQEASLLADRPSAETIGAPIRDVIGQFLCCLLRRAHTPEHHCEHPRVGLDGRKISEVSAPHGGQH